MKRLFNIRSIMLTIVLLLGAIPVAAIERPFALNGRGVGTFHTDEAGNVISADVTASGNPYWPVDYCRERQIHPR
jgi:hypothetical protein